MAPYWGPSRYGRRGNRICHEYNSRVFGEAYINREAFRMDRNAKIYIAGHTGLIGSAVVRKLKSLSYKNIITRTHKEMDLTERDKAEEFFKKERPEYVFLAAARVGGIYANSAYPAEFIYENL